MFQLVWIASFVIDEIELNFENAIAAGNWRSGEAACVDIERHLPPMIHRRAQREPHFADDLGPHVKCGIGIVPGSQRKFGPGVLIGDGNVREHRNLDVESGDINTVLRRCGVRPRSVSYRIAARLGGETLHKRKTALTG